MNLIDYINERNKKIARSLFVYKKEEFVVSELQMHKILFILYGGFYKHFKKELFNANFEAWKYGPVEVNYRNCIKNFEEDNSFSHFDIKDKLSKDESNYLKKIISILLKKSVWTLVEITHAIPAWYDNFNENKKHCKISNKDIHKSFKIVEI